MNAGAATSQLYGVERLVHGSHGAFVRDIDDELVKSLGITRLAAVRPILIKRYHHTYTPPAERVVQWLI